MIHSPSYDEYIIETGDTITVYCGDCREYIDYSGSLGTSVKDLLDAIRKHEVET